MVYFCIFLATVASAISAFIPLVYGRLVDEAIKPNADLELIGVILFLWLVFALSANWISRFVDFKGESFGGKVFHVFMVDIFNHYLQLPLDFHKNEKLGKQISKINRSGQFLWDMIGDMVFYLAPGFLTALIAIFLMYITEWKLATMIVFILFLYTLATILKTKPIVKARKIINKSWEKSWGHIYDTAGNIRVVKSHTKEEYERKEVKRNFDYSVNKSIGLMDKSKNLKAWQENIHGFGFVLIFAAGLYLLTQKQISTGILVTFIGYVNLVFRPFNQLTHIYRRAQEGVVIIGRAIKLYDIKTELYDYGKKLEKIKGKIEFKNVSFAYGEKFKKVLSNINFTVKHGETVALVGESGAGKTTLLSLISRYYHLNSGKIFLDNNDINDINLIFLREQIAIVPQEVSLFNDTLKKNLIYAKNNANNKEIVEALKAANAWEFVSNFPKKLNQKVGERGIKLSTGQKQRIAIARAILRDPKILILDEATSSLDSISEKLVQDALKKLIAGRTTFIIAHRLSTITHADKILVFDKGKLVEQGNHEKLVKSKGVYWSLYKEQKF